MQPVIQDFAEWFTQFILVGTIIMVAGHFVGSKMRAKKKLKLKEKQAS